MGSSTGSLLVADDAGVAAILSRTRRRAAFHSEDEDRLEERKPLRVPGDPSSHPVWRDEIAALRSTRAAACASPARRARSSMCCMSRRRRRSSFSPQHKDIASVEVTPHHLTLDVAGLCAPRHARADEPAGARRRAIATGCGAGVGQGVVDVLGSDHAPHTLEEKAKPYPESPSGMTGVQTLVPLMLDHVNAGRLTLRASSI